MASFLGHFWDWNLSLPPRFDLFPGRLYDNFKSWSLAWTLDLNLKERNIFEWNNSRWVTSQTFCGFTDIVLKQVSTSLFKIFYHFMMEDHGPSLVAQSRLYENVYFVRCTSYCMHTDFKNNGLRPTCIWSISS